jgi:BioD-like phosphotransacetylase family protein
MKPLGRLHQKKDELVGDSDALVVQEVLGQNMPADVLSPLMLPPNLHALAGAETEGTAMRRIADCYAQIAEGKDIVLVSGTGAFPAAGRFASADGFSIVRALGLKVLFVERYADRRINYDELLLYKDMLGSSMLGIVLNDVPEEETRDTKKWLAPWLKERGIALLGLLGHEPGLLAMRVVDLAHGLNGRVVAGSRQATRMVNNFVIGTMQVDNFMMHLRRKEGCAVIVGGDRSDLQLAALHSSSPCIILTCNIPPCELIRSKAEDLGVTLMVVHDDTYMVARNMSRILRSKKIRDLGQIKIAVGMVENGLDLQSIFDKIG